MPAALRVLIVDDHPIVASGCRAMLGPASGVEILVASDAASGEAAFFAERPDVCVVDINLPGVSGFILLQRILARAPDAKVAMFSMNDAPGFAARAIEAGARGFVSKSGDPADIVTAIRRLAEGGTFVSADVAQALAFARPAATQDALAKLSPRELEIVRLLAGGRSLADIAAALEAPYKTIANTASLIRQKLGVKSAADLVRLAMDNGLA